MADRAFERAFARATAQAVTIEELHDPEMERCKRRKTEEARIRRIDTDMTTADAIERILLAHKDRDYFRMLALAPPELDALGRPQWSVTAAEISKAYRKLAVLVHPDKNPGDEARQAFEALKQASRSLQDAGELEKILKDYIDQARARREEAEARATLEEKVALNAKYLEEANVLRKQETAALQTEILRQMKEKQERARKRKELRRRRGSSDNEEDGAEGLHHDSDVVNPKAESDSDDDDAERRRKALASRRTQLRKAAAM